CREELPPEDCWQKVLPELKQITNFNLHQFIYERIYPDWDQSPSPTWFPDKEIVDNSNIFKAIKELNLSNYKEFHRYSVEQWENFWDYTIKKLGIKFHTSYENICDLSKGFTKPNWLVNATLNIAESCFHSDTQNLPAIVYANEAGQFKTI